MAAVQIYCLSPPQTQFLDPLLDFISFWLFVWTNYLIFSKCILYTGAWYPEEELYQKPSEGIGDKMDHFVNVTSECQQYVDIGFNQIAHGKFLSFSEGSAQEGVSAQGGVCLGGVSAQGSVYPSMHWGRNPPPMNRMTGVKTLPCRNYVADGNNTNSPRDVLGLFDDRMLISCYSHIKRWISIH